MNIPKFEDVAQTQWFHDDQYFVHELTVQFNAGFMQRFPSRLTGEVCERAQHECVEQLRRNVHKCAAGTCKADKLCDGYLYYTSYWCRGCDERFAYRPIGGKDRGASPKFCPNCGARIEVGA